LVGHGEARSVKTVLVVASAGGHLAEARAAISVLKGFRVVLLTEKIPGLTPGPDAVWHKVYAVPILGMTWPRLCAFLALACLYSLVVFAKEKPTAVFSTGAELALPPCLFGKLLFRRRLIFLESLTRIGALSRTGRYLLRWTDLFLVQHASLAQALGPRVQYWGSVL
jgi:UDP-N-acetylglucosamine:LPS N-acetylglucosamine transferase